MYRCLYENLMGIGNLKTTIDIHTKKKKQPNITLKMTIKPQEKKIKEERKKKYLQKQTPNN